jgi:hypothetical protein
MTPDDTPATPARIKFGARPDDDMPASWAERLLTWLKETHPATFAAGMFAVLDIEKKRR